MKSTAEGPAPKRRADSDAIEWKDYPRIVPGEYRAYSKFGKQYRDPGFRRWLCLLRWDVLTDDLLHVIACVPQFFPLGAGDKPHASRRGKYLPEWIRANSAPPVRGDRLTPRVFVHRLARIEVGDTDGPIPYSVVRRIIEWETGLPGHSVSKSHSQGWQASGAFKSEGCQEALTNTPDDFQARDGGVGQGAASEPLAPPVGVEEGDTG
jgi:hypothetical protein